MKESATSRAMFILLAGLARPAMNMLMAKKWEGIGKLPAGGFIAVPNHCTEIDPIVVGHLVYNQNRPPHFLAKAGLFKVPVLGSLLRATKQIPVERSTAGANRSLQLAKEVVDAGGAIIIYPEGTLTRDPDLWPMKGHTGAARLALQTGAPVVPMAHWGAQEVFPRYAKRFHVFPRKTVRVLVGEPVDLSSFADRPLDRATLTEATDVIMDAITALLETLRGEKAPAERWDPALHKQSKHGRFVEGAPSETQDPEAGK
ncbi:lysophospholipid acyltransferase family protein [Paenarthrobacter nicotinovorans]|uniref:lysophospholipid acyltransferase family protein n=1 Tax=Paenarthrobacter nicotinovorans TaxID=29320 RepID=UPI003A7F9454